MAEGSQRRGELEANLRRVNERIDAAMAACGRTGRPSLIVVTKFFPASDVRLLAELGVRDVGENRDQEASEKASSVGDRSLRWHFIGQLQSNKARSVVSYAHSVHSVDRMGLVDALQKAAQREAERGGAGEASEELRPRELLDCFVQVNLDPNAAPGRGGARPEEVQDLAAAIDAAPHLRIAGVMAVAPLGGVAREAFGRLADISAEVKARFPDAAAISAGMSGDLEEAVAAGATHLRIGSDVLGARPPVG
ncbi:YggS family pyridoxal phosphate-dependent enzyme [Arthrobacter sp. JZ12]|uniref:YggS family pyridoxal phosphate-dependent enzyme n=1 Tax=Arthrobacter sp. JZ12 TaxID=2654190 RepID=UPI002B4A64C2|nr:YggS family pyridoxal phosphate-dependent enzyme [Arthrobacter sp. JZ12]